MSSSTPSLFSPSPLVLGLSHPGFGLLLQLARGIAWSPTFQIKMRSAVAPAIKAPSGVKASATTGRSIVIEHLGLLSGSRAFHIDMAQSSPPEANNRSSAGGVDCNGCHIRQVMRPKWAVIVRRSPASFHSCPTSVKVPRRRFALVLHQACPCR